MAKGIRDPDIPGLAPPPAGTLPCFGVASPTASSTLAVDVGGTKLAAGEVSDSGRLVRRSSLSTPGTSSDDELFEALVELLEPYQPFDRYRACGVGCSGPMTKGGELVAPLDIPAWRSFPLQERMTRHTGLNVGVDNDAKALALAEGWVGAARSAPSYLGVVVSTGIGGGIVVNRRLLDGDTGNAGHIGQMIVAVPGRPLAEPRAQLVRGSLEAEVSGAAIEVRTGHRTSEATTAVIAEAGRMVGQVVASVANLLDLRLAVVAGSVALGFGEPFFAAAQAEMDRICRFDYSRGARIEPAGCGDEGPLIGAAAVGLRVTGERPGGIS